MPAPQIILDLVQRFSDSRDQYRSGHYNEAQLRREFLDPLFTALGWDLTNQQGYAPQYREVIQETSLNIEGQAKAPDYEFRIGQTPKFFVEAKKPAVNIQYDIHPAFQLRRYAWSAHLPLSILTDFEEFAVYDTRVKPNFKDAASVARIFFFRYTDYADKWDEIAAIFSKSAIPKGSFDRYVQDNKAKKGTAEVDDAFLSAIETWRELLARNIALRNPQARTERALNYAVQMTLDRIIFLRICEDRGIEPERQLDELANAPQIYPRLVNLFIKADQKYNSGLFHFSKEKAQTSDEDAFTPSLAIDDKALKQIIADLYYPQSPFAFKVLPVEILGQVYEQFLGKVIRLTPGGSAKVEEKPEVRKAGGVYYTPRYIVDYIVQNTVGKLLEGKTPPQVASLRVVDPACGSGSFLLGAFQYLLDWHLAYYLAPENGGPQAFTRGKSPALLPASDGSFQLTTSEKKRILVDNIYGVDLDQQAVEVTKLSLLLKLLEEETGQLSLGFERVLPDLGHNIRCGNSLIGWDYFHGQLLADEEEVRRVNPFDWQQAFPEVFAAGGFDAVIGNPPYLNIDDTWGKGDLKLKAIKAIYSEVYRDKTDLLFYFLMKGVILTKGYLGFIISRAFLEAYKADKLRDYLANNSSVVQLIDFQNKYIFAGVGISTCILLLTKLNNPSDGYVFKLIDEKNQLLDLKDALINDAIFDQHKIKHEKLKKGSWIFSSDSVQELYDKIDEQGIPLADVLTIGQGMQTGANNVFGERTLEEIEKWGLHQGQFFKRASNSDIQKFHIKDRQEYLLYPQAFNEFREMPKSLQDYLQANSVKLKARAAYIRGNCEWWKFTWPLNEKYYTQKRILCPYLSPINRFAIDKNNEFLSLTDTTVLFDNNQPEDLYYFLGLLNSKLLDFRFKGIGKFKGSGIYEYFWNSLGRLYVKRIDFSDKKELNLHNQIADHAKQLTNLSNTKTRTPLEQEQLQRNIISIRNYIDDCIFKLYGISEDILTQAGYKTDFDRQ